MHVVHINIHCQIHGMYYELESALILGVCMSISTAGIQLRYYIQLSKADVIVYIVMLITESYAIHDFGSFM